MGSRAVLQEQQNRAVRGKPKDGQAEAITRRVLRDIGNLGIAPVVEGKPQNQITRPVTKCSKTESFGAQLLAKAQTAAERKNLKKPIVGNVNAAKAKVPKREPLKPKKEDVIVISSDEEEIDNKRKNPKEKSFKVHGKTLTAVLTARSKDACGIAKKPKDLILDIDASDVDNELAAVEYVEDMYHFHKLTEKDGQVHDYMNTQPEINSKMRAILVDWLIEVHKKFELMPESLYLTINIVDRFLSLRKVPRRELQLVGVSAMLIACKYEEIWAPEVSDFIAISDNAYVREQVLLMEKAILGKLEWYLTVPTPYVFLVRYVKAAAVPTDKKIEHMSFFFAELGLMSYSTIVNYCPSMLAAASVYAARCTLNRVPAWTETLKHHTGFYEDQLMDCAKMLVGLHSVLTDNKLKAVSKKYSDLERASVALFPPATSLLPSPCVV